MKRFKQWTKMLRGILPAAIVAVGLFLTGSTVKADTAAKISSTVVADDCVYIYIRGIDNIQPESVIRIGSAACSPEQIAVGKLADLEVPMRTLILVDNSLSIPESNRKDIRDIMAGLIERALPNEQFKIGTFSNDVKYLCDYTADADQAIACVDGIEYQNQTTYFSNALYDILNQISAEHSKFYTRVIMISDGADNHEIGYTNAEVRALVSESGIPVYTIGMKTKNNNKELETMFAFSRAGNAEYYLLDGTVSAENVVSELSEDQWNLCVRLKPDESLMDGSNKKILLKLQTGNGQIELTTDADMPFPSTETPKQTQEPEPEPKPSEPQTEEKKEPKPANNLPTIGGNAEEKKADESDEEEEKGFPVLLLAIILGTVVLCLLITVVLIVVMRKKKVAPAPVPAPAVQPAQPAPEPVSNKTMMIKPAGAAGNTVGLWNAGTDNKPRQAYLVLRSLDNPAVMYKVPITDVVHIGRSNADIVVNDQYVSGKHCEIILRGDILYIKDSGSSNGTFYENMQVYEEKPIVSGGRIRIGQSNFRVELVRE